MKAREKRLAEERVVEWVRSIAEHTKPYTIHWCDVVGRRPTAILCLLGTAAAIAAFYRTRYLFPAFAAIVFFESGIQIAVNALSTEVLPHRAARDGPRRGSLTPA